MRAFLKTSGHGLFAGGLSFAVGLDFDAKKMRLKKSGPSGSKFFRPKDFYDFLLPDLPPGRNLLQKQI